MTPGKIVVILFATLFIGFGVLATIARYSLTDDVYLNQAGLGLAKVQKAAVVWAEAGEDRYPPHIALLKANNYFRARLLRDPRQPEGTVWTVGNFDAQPFLEEVIQHDDQERLDRVPLEAAVAADPDAESDIYRFGDYFFVRLDKYRNHSELIFGYTLPDEQGRLFVVFDNGNAKRVNAPDVPQVWERDAAARIALGLDPLDHGD